MRFPAKLQLIYLIWTISLPLIAEEAVDLDNEQEVEENDSSRWFDRSHSFLSDQTDSLALWIDNFFGTPRSDLESATSSLRITFRDTWEEGLGTRFALRVRGKVRLPQLSNRLSLIFFDQEEENDVNQSVEEQIVDSEDNNGNQAAIQYTAIDQKRSRLDFNAGLRSRLKLKLRARYRYESALGSRFRGRHIDTLFFRDGEGFGITFQPEIDRPLTDNKLLRWSNNFEYAEKSNGLEWASTLGLAHRINDKSAISYFTLIRGETRPDHLTTLYGLGMRFRSNFLRPWLFYELEPLYGWQRRESIDNREPTAFFTARLEIALGK